MTSYTSASAYIIFTLCSCYDWSTLGKHGANHINLQYFMMCKYWSAFCPFSLTSCSLERLSQHILSLSTSLRNSKTPLGLPSFLFSSILWFFPGSMFLFYLVLKIAASQHLSHNERWAWHWLIVPGGSVAVNKINMIAAESNMHINKQNQKLAVKGSNELAK